MRVVGVVGGVRAEGFWARIGGLEIFLKDWEGTGAVRVRTVRA